VLEIVFGVDMRGMFLEFLFAGAFLASCFRDALILLALRAGNGCGESREAQKKNRGGDKTCTGRNSPEACATGLDGQRAVDVSQQHGKPTTGGLRVRRSVPGDWLEGKIFS